MSERKILIIPARSGSKRIKNKNFIKIGKKKLIDHVINNAINSKIFDKIIISTDNKSYINQSIFKNTKKIFFEHRNPKLSNSYSFIIDVVKSIIKKYKLNHDLVCCTFPTAIFINKKIYKMAFKQQRKNKKLIIVPIKEYEHPISRAIDIIKKNKAKLVSYKFSNKRTQDLKKYYYDSGQFYLAKGSVWYREKKILSSNFCPMILNKKETRFLIDIDEPEDLKILKLLYTIKNEI